MGTKISQFNLSALCLSTALVMSGCVSGDVANDIGTLSSSEIPIPQSSVANGLEDGSALQASTDVGLPTNGIPIPSSAPRPTLAMTAEATTSNEPAVQQATALASETSTLNTPTTDQTGQTTMATAVVEPAKTISANPAPAAPPRKLTFFELLRKKAEDRKAAELLAKNKQEEKLRVARLESAAKKKATASSLPGVKKGDALFGISEEKGEIEEKANVQVASVGGFARSLVKNGLVLQTSAVQVGCFKPELMKVLKVVERKYGRKVMVTSGYRSPARNRRAGGVRNSSHVYCKAADIQVVGVSKWDLAKFLRTIPNRGGVGTYCRTKSVHIDVGSQRDWHHPCKRRSSKKRKS